MTHKTDAWVLYAGEKGSREPAELKRETFEFDDISSEEVLVSPLYGCWEGNMGHALTRTPVDVGSEVDNVRPGDKAIVFCNGVWDKYGYPKKIFAYDAPGTIGVLARKTKLHQKQVIAIPPEYTFDLERWAAFSLRYVTAWSNFRLAYGMLRLELTEQELPDPVVWGWGGGVSLAELHLARLRGCRTFQVSSHGDRQAAAKRLGIAPIDRNEFPNLIYDEGRYKSDPEYKRAYKESEARFLEIVDDLTVGRGVNIFLDYVGSPVIRATLKAMARQGVLATAGWKEGMFLWFLRAVECIDRHQHVHTHYARYGEGIQAVRFAVANEWLPVVDERIYEFDEIPELARAYEEGRFTYFPVFKVNAE